MAAEAAAKGGSEAKTQPEAKPDTNELLKLYREMLLIRRFEEKAGQLYGMGLIAGFCHLYIGQEAVVVGLQASATDQDSVITTYRDHGHMLATGMDPKGVMAELTGRIGGYSKGKGGSMHMFSREKKFYGGHGIVGASVPLGTGLAFAHKYRERRRHQLLLLRRRRRQPGPGLRGLQHGQRCGSCRSSTSSRTTATAWARRSSGLRRPPSSTAAARRSAFPAWRSTAWTCSR